VQSWLLVTTKLSFSLKGITKSRVRKKNSGFPCRGKKAFSSPAGIYTQSLTLPGSQTECFNVFFTLSFISLGSLGEPPATQTLGKSTASSLRLQTKVYCSSPTGKLGFQAVRQQEDRSRTDKHTRYSSKHLWRHVPFTPQPLFPHHSSYNYPAAALKGKQELDC